MLSVAHNFAYLPLWNVANSESRGQQTCLLSSLNVERPIIYIWAAHPQRPITIYATMRHTRSFIVSTLFAFASAQVRSTSKFTNPWLTAYVVGTTYQISWTVGDDRPVSLTISNSTWGLDLACEFENSSGEPFFHWLVPLQHFFLHRRRLRSIGRYPLHSTFSAATLCR